MLEGIGFFIFVVLALWVYKVVGHLYDVASSYVSSHENIIVLAAILFFSFLIIAFRKKRKNGRTKSRESEKFTAKKSVQISTPSSPKLTEAERNVVHAEKQLRLIKKSAPFKRKGLLNDSEYKSLQRIKKLLSDNGLAGYIYVLPQVALGAYLGHNNYIHKTINTKRADFLLVDRGYYPLCAIEINGTGHCLDGSALLRDEIKQLAIEGAGIEYFSIEFSFNTRNESFSSLDKKLVDFISRYKEKKFSSSTQYYSKGKASASKVSQ